MATKPTKSSTKVAAKITAKKISKKAEIVDQVLLKLGHPPYKKIMKQIENGKKLINEERRLALELGTRILKKAKEVRDSLMQKTRVNRGR